MKWCCPGFEAFYNNAGQQGAGILVGRDSIGEPEFTMQYRAADAGERLAISSEGPILSVVDIRMQYCVWCGRNLDKWYGSKVDVLYRPSLKITPP